MRFRLPFSAAVLLAALIPASNASAQDFGGFGGRGGGRNAGGLDMSLAPFYSDLTGPFAFDSVQVLLSLEAAQRAKLDKIRVDHIAKTQALMEQIEQPDRKPRHVRCRPPGRGRRLDRADPGSEAGRNGRQGEGPQGVHQAPRTAAQDRQRLLPQDRQACPESGPVDVLQAVGPDEGLPTG